MTDQIYFKVVTDDRKSITINNTTHLQDKNKYCLIYNKDTIVTAPEESFGIFIFKDFQEAKNFRHIYLGTILQVKPIGDISKITRILDTFFIYNLGEIYNRIVIKSKQIKISFDTIMKEDISVPIGKPPEGTYVCKSVMVLD